MTIVPLYNKIFDPSYKIIGVFHVKDSKNFVTCKCTRLKKGILEKMKNVYFYVEHATSKRRSIFRKFFLETYMYMFFHLSTYLNSEQENVVLEMSFLKCCGEVVFVAALVAPRLDFLVVVVVQLPACL